MGLSSAVQWWQEWQLRILVLGSLSVQLFLFFAEEVRRLRWLARAAYIGGDALAIYALGTLFNRQKYGGSSALEVVWAPVLIIHLGGQTSITAYSLEDNEQWRRHAITLVSKVTVALYVFVKWSSGEKRLLLAAVLLFVLGILKFSEKPWTLRNASFNSMLASTNVSPRREGCIAVCWAWFTSSIGGKTLIKKLEGGGERALLLKEYVQKAKVVHVLGSDEAKAYALEGAGSDQANPSDIYEKFVDLSIPYSGRLSDLESFLKFDEGNAYYASQALVEQVFSRLYTRQRSELSPLGFCLTFVVPGFLALAPVVLFAASHKDGYNENDVRVTYILFCCTAVQSFLPWLTVISRLNKLVSPLNKLVSQHSLMSFCAREKKPTPLMKLATFVCLRRYVNKHWYISQVPAALQITKLVHRHVKDGWNTYITDPASYRAFNNLRGQWTLRRSLPTLPDTDPASYRQLRWSLTDLPFDESVLVWHIATDLCFHQPAAFSTVSPPHLQELEAARKHGREISNYMVYLLFIHREMLMPCTRPGLFTNVIYDLELILKDSRGALLNNEETLARETIHRVESLPTDTATATVITHACWLAKALMQLGDEAERWQVIQGVWVEMLCYSASRCRGYLHAKSLGEGGEYLTNVWLIWSYMGMETLADRLQRPPPLEEEVGAAAVGRANHPAEELV